MDFFFKTSKRHFCGRRDRLQHRYYYFAFLDEWRQARGNRGKRDTRDGGTRRKNKPWIMTTARKSSGKMKLVKKDLRLFTFTIFPPANNLSLINLLIKQLVQLWWSISGPVYVTKPTCILFSRWPLPSDIMKMSVTCYGNSLYFWFNSPEIPNIQEKKACG